MTDEDQIHTRIEQLVAEEQDLYDRGADGGLNANEHNRLESIKVGLDQCWDLLRQRRALRGAGKDPDAAPVGDPGVVERYGQEPPACLTPNAPEPAPGGAGSER